MYIIMYKRAFNLLRVLTKAPGSLFSRSLANRMPQPWLTPLRRLNALFKLNLRHSTSRH